MDSDGTTVLGTDYFVCDGTGTILTSYTPSFSAAPTVPSELEGKIVSLVGWTDDCAGRHGGNELG